jgi:hypothetical protein
LTPKRAIIGTQKTLIGSYNLYPLLSSLLSTLIGQDSIQVPHFFFPLDAASTFSGYAQPDNGGSMFLQNVHTCNTLNVADTLKV